VAAITGCRVGIGTKCRRAGGTPYPATSWPLGIDIGAEELFGVLSTAGQSFAACGDCGRGFGEIRGCGWTEPQGWGRRLVGIGGSTVAGIFETIDDGGCMVVRLPAARGSRYLRARSILVRQRR